MFPQKFQADVATTDVIEDEIRNQIRQLDGQIQDMEKLSNNVVGMALITPIFVDLKRKLQEKLEALYRFDAETATSFDRAMDLTANIVRGLAEIDSDKAFQAKTGTFHMMGLNMAWRSALQKQWTAREEAMAKLAKDNETERLIKAAENGPLPVIPEGNVAGFVTKDGKLDGKATYDNAKWQQAHVLAGMKNAIFLIDMVAPIFDIYRWKTGLDPITQEKLSPFEQNEAAAFTALNFIPFGKLGKAAKAIKASTRTDEFKFLFENLDDAEKLKSFNKGIGVGKEVDKIDAILSPEIEAKILEGQRVEKSNKIIGGHSPIINNENPIYATETIQINSDGTRVIKYTKQFPNGDISKTKTSTIFPKTWSDKNILDAIRTVVDSTAPIGQRNSDTLYRGSVNGVEIDVIKRGDNITAGYPLGGKPTPGFTPID